MHKIIYCPGTYGAYLEFVLNQCLSPNEFKVTDVVSEFDTCHDKVWDMRKNLSAANRFISYHDWNLTDNEKFVVVDFEVEDNILVIQLLMRRAGNSNIDISELEKNTYFKLIHHTKLYKGQSSSKIIDNINKFSDIAPYYDIKDPDWPDIDSVDDFYNLPKHIINECDNVFNFLPFYLSESRPDAPRWALRQFFRLWFIDEEKLPVNEIKIYNQNPNAYKLNLNDIYDIDKFKQELLKIGKYFDLDINLKYFSTDMYYKVIKPSVYKNIKYRCEQIIHSVINGISIPIDLNVIEEGYLIYLLEKKFNIDFPLNEKHFFTNTSEIIKIKNT